MEQSVISAELWQPGQLALHLLVIFYLVQDPPLVQKRLSSIICNEDKTLTAENLTTVGFGVFAKYSVSEPNKPTVLQTPPK